MDRGTGKTAFNLTYGALTLCALLNACSAHSTAAHRASSPSPAPTVCDAAASVVTQAQPDFPDEVRGKVQEAQVRIAVSVSRTGKLTHATVIKSGGFPALDTAALGAALHSTYSPAIVRCKPVAGTYIFAVTFSGGR